MGVSPEHKRLGLEGAIVMRHSNIIPRNQSFKLFLDNYFTSMGLIRLFKENGILALGVVKFNCMTEGCILKKEKELRKEG